MATIYDIVNKTVEKTVVDLRKNLLKKWKARKYGLTNENSRLLASIKGRTFNTASGIEGYIEQNDYWYWVNYGRDAGNVAQYANIAQWIKIKGINVVKIISDMREEARLQNVKDIRNLRVGELKPPTYKKAVEAFDFLVRRKLQREGYEGNYYFTEVIEDGRLDKLNKRIEDAVTEEGIVFDDKTNSFTIRFK